jgi:hypothetical protein
VGTGRKSRKGLHSLRSFTELEFLHFLETVTGWLVPQKIQFAENRFLQAGKEAENTKEKSRQCFM